MLKIVIARLKFILFECDMSFTEMLISTCHIGWGVVLLLIQPHLISTSPSYNPMYQVAPQWVWGCMFLGTGLIMMTGDVLNMRMIRAVGTFLSGTLWVFITLMFAVTTVTPTGMIVYGAFALTCFLALHRHVNRLVLRAMPWLRRVRHEQ